MSMNVPIGYIAVLNVPMGYFTVVDFSFGVDTTDVYFQSCLFVFYVCVFFHLCPSKVVIDFYI